MADGPHRGTQHIDRDGVRTTQTADVRRSVWLLALAITLVGVAVFVVVRPAMQSVPPQSREPRPGDLAAEAPAPRATVARKPSRPTVAARFEGVLPPDVKPTPEPERAPVQPPPESDAAAGETDAAKGSDGPTGIALFPPPGTKPIKRGIIVPDGVELPPGYVRHYQTTDDGRQLPPILMFHPDYHPVDGHGDPIPLPDDRIVPPDMAPPGISVQMLDLPENAPPANEMPGRVRREPAP